MTYEPPSVLEYRWGEDILRFELQPDGDGTVLTLLDTLEELGKAARDGAGWHLCLDSPARHLAGEGPATEPWQPVYASSWNASDRTPPASARRNRSPTLRDRRAILARETGRRSSRSSIAASWAWLAPGPEPPRALQELRRAQHLA